MEMNKEELCEEDIKLIEAINQIPGFDVEATEEGLETFDQQLADVEESLRDLEPALDSIKIKTKVHDLTREVVVTFQTNDDATFKLLQTIAPYVELVPVLIRAENLADA